jgi:hypothetical protein
MSTPRSFLANYPAAGTGARVTGMVLSSSMLVGIKDLDRSKCNHQRVFSNLLVEI